jgi:nitrite reductase/ring-hydroxylating ferredoxin subunit
MPAFQNAASVTEIAPGSGKTVTCGGKSLAVFNVGGTFRAIDNTCLHRGGPLGEGTLEGGVVTCPRHGWQYDLTNGECVFNPAAKVKTYPAKVEGGQVMVEV